MASKIEQKQKFTLLSDKENDIAGSSVPSKIRGLIFDFGSTIFKATEKSTKIKMENAMKQTLSSHFKWTTTDTKLFWSHYKDIAKEYESKKLFIGTGCCLDNGHWPEPTIKSWIIEACKRMNTISINPSDKIYDDAIRAFRTPRIENAKIIKNSIETMKELKYKYGIKSAICSNERCPSRLRGILRKYQLLNDDMQTSQLFDCIIVSAEIGFRKPDARIVEPILTRWKNEYGIKREEIVFIGDKLHTDIRAARYCGLRAIHCKLYNRNDDKFKTQKSVQQNPFLIKFDTYLGAHSDDFLHKFNEYHSNFNIPDAVLTDYSDFIQILQKMASTKEQSLWRPLVIGVLLRREKIEKFGKMRVFEVNEYRKDVIFKAIDSTQNISKQGPFDIILHKLNWDYFNAKYVPKIAQNLENALKYFNSVNTNLADNECKEKESEIGKTYISDDPFLGSQCMDRWFVYNAICNADIRVSYANKQNVKILCPKTILLKYEQIKELNATIKGIHHQKTEHLVLSGMQNMHFPLVLKPRQSGRTATGRYDGHCLYIIPSMDSLNDEIFEKLLENEEGDWLCQEYVDHNCGCHKVYNLGYFVFASMNSSTPSLQSIEDSKQWIQINSTGISSKMSCDQSKRDNLSSQNGFYQNIAKQLKGIFGVKLFGFDMIFDKVSNNAFIVDFNFMPSFKIVPNFHTLLTEYLLFEYSQFIQH